MNELDDSSIILHGCVARTGAGYYFIKDGALWRGKRNVGEPLGRFEGFVEDNVFERVGGCSNSYGEILTYSFVHVRWNYIPYSHLAVLPTRGRHEGVLVLTPSVLELVHSWSTKEALPSETSMSATRDSMFTRSPSLKGPTDFPS